MTTVIVIILLVILVGFMIYVFRQITEANRANVQSFINVDITLKKRYELIPRLEKIVKEYAGTEKYLIERLEQIGPILSEKMTIADREKQENKYSVIIRDVIAIAENYPLMKDSDEFLKVQNELLQIEEEVEVSRRYYNDTTRSYNALIKKFPHSLLVAILGYSRGTFFDVDLLTRKRPEINFEDRRQQSRD